MAAHPQNSHLAPEDDSPASVSPASLAPVDDAQQDATPIPQEARDSRASSSSNSPAPVDNEESDFYHGNNDSTSSIGVVNIQDMNMDDLCWPPINKLPNEILLHIFSSLTSVHEVYACMMVCRRWARNAVDMLWHRPACSSWTKHQTICQTLEAENPYFNYKQFIKRLNLASLGEGINDGSVMPLAVCTRVERLTLTNCHQITDQGLTALINGNSSLLAIDISNDKNITERSINAMAENCKRLQGLNISGCELISNESMVNLAQSCKSIKRLKLNECKQLRDDAILAFAQNCPNILEIDLQQCELIGNRPITSLLSMGNCLRELRLANCELVGDEAFLSIRAGRTFEHLRILDLTSCTNITDRAVEKIIEVAPRLRNLVLAKCRMVTDASVNAIAQLGKNLHYVHLGHCQQITDEGVKRLVNSCNRIRYIDLGCCPNLTDDSVKRLAQLPKLKRIGLVKCTNITDESVLALADAANRPRVRRDARGAPVSQEYYTSSLERVHLSYCVNLTLDSIWQLLNTCPKLTHLSLTGVQAFQNDDFSAFCRQAPAEFTPHQRDVFCVFSGYMVKKFREYLNTSRYGSDLRFAREEREREAREAQRARYVQEMTMPYDVGMRSGPPRQIPIGQSQSQPQAGHDTQAATAAPRSNPVPEVPEWWPNHAQQNPPVFPSVGSTQLPAHPTPLANGSDLASAPSAAYYSGPTHPSDPYSAPHQYGPNNGYGGISINGGPGPALGAPSNTGQRQASAASLGGRSASGMQGQQPLPNGEGSSAASAAPLYQSSPSRPPGDGDESN